MARAIVDPVELRRFAIDLKRFNSDLQAQVTDIKKSGIKILPVDVNMSRMEHAIEVPIPLKPPTGIRLSLRSVLGVGDSAIEKLIEAREGQVSLGLEKIMVATLGPATQNEKNKSEWPALGGSIELKTDKTLSVKGGVWDTADLGEYPKSWKTGKARPATLEQVGRELLNEEGITLVKMAKGKLYEDFDDFFTRSGCNKTAMVPLIRIGAFQDLSPNMKATEIAYEKFCADPKLKSLKRLQERRDIFDRELAFPDYSAVEKINFENEYMGFSLRGSPFDILDRDTKIQALFDGVVLDYREFLESDMEVGMLPVVVKDVRERPQKNGRMFAFLKLAVESGEEFDTVCFNTIWQHISSSVKKGCVYVATFNRRPEDPTNLILGKPGFAHSVSSSHGFMINIDNIEM